MNFASAALLVYFAVSALVCATIVVSEEPPAEDPPPMVEPRQDPLVIDTADTGDSAETGGDRG